MVRPDLDPRRFARLIGGCGRALGPGLAVLALAIPGAAHPCSLEQLLRLPFERLLQLDVSQPGAAPAWRSGRTAVAAAASDRSGR